MLDRHYRSDLSWPSRSLFSAAGLRSREATDLRPRWDIAFAQLGVHLPSSPALRVWWEGGRASRRKRAARFDPGGVPYRRGLSSRNMVAVARRVMEKVTKKTGLR